MTTDRAEPTIGGFVDSLPPGETVRIGGLDFIRWAEPGDGIPDREPANRAERRGNPRQRGRHLARIRRNYGRNS